MPDQFAYDVFLSHSAKDKPTVRELAERLRKDGLKIWFDEWVIRPGDMIGRVIEEGLESSRVLVLAMSRHALESEWATLESGTFRFRDPTNKARRFIPLRLDDADIKDSLKQFAYVDWRKRSDEQYENLLRTCRPVETPSPLGSRSDGSLENVAELSGLTSIAVSSDCGRALTETTAPVWKLTLANMLIDIIVAAEEIGPRSVMEYWVSRQQSECEHWARDLRDLATEHLEEDAPELQAQIMKLADDCQTTADSLEWQNWQGASIIMEEHMPKLKEQALSIRQAHFDRIPFSESSLEKIRKVLKTVARKARNLDRRTDERRFNFDDLASEALRIAEEALRLSYYKLPFLDEEAVFTLRESLKELHLLETIRIDYSAGSCPEFKQAVTSAADKLEAIASKL